MDGMKRAEVDRAEAYALAPVRVPMRPRDAGTLLVLDRSTPTIRVLMGRRHSGHAFMPGKMVFPGGRTDPTDGRVALSRAIDPVEVAKLTRGGAQVTTARARAIVMSALRETYEETGLLIGRRSAFRSTHPAWQGFAEHGIEPAPDRLRFIARAVTPPGRVRRFDTRFFAAWRDDVALELADGGPTAELEALAWLSLDEARAADVPEITRTILGELAQRLAADPELEPGGQIPFYRLIGNIFTRQEI